MYITTYSAGVFYQVLYAFFMYFKIAHELLQVGRKPQRDRVLQARWVEYFIVVIVWYMNPAQEQMSYKSLSESGLYNDVTKFLFFEYH